MTQSARQREKSTTVRTEKRNRERIIRARRKRANQAARIVSWLSDKRPVETAQLAELLWSLPRRSERPGREVTWLDSGISQSVPSGMGNLKAWVWGTGPTVLLVHGWDGRGSQLGAFIKPLVDSGHRVVTFDSRGHGDSFGKRASLVSFADAVTAMARHFGPLHGIIAHSFGAAGTMYALRSGLHVPRVVFLGPVNARHGADRFARFLKISPECADIFKGQVEKRMGHTFEILKGTALQNEIRPDLLIYHDEEDLFVPITDAEEITLKWPEAKLVKTKGLGHHRILRDPNIIDASIEFFMGTSSKQTVAA
ncbi:MAG: alpha/beta fold hydrolase [Deltaproteobacteria bacterium]|jgi:pimeloyl-ACP methyl ester carboxylesterase|nr:alpha/beta fold hydrolase [Deltaproteobacteria bacterium]MBT6491224.1 alpha/beta fold hydrolase [Deltaproteobacteria bacterium]